MAHTYSKQLVAGTPENVNDVMTDLNEAAADWEGAFSSYKVLHTRSTIMAGAGGSATYLFADGGGLFNASTNFSAGSQSPVVLYLDAANDMTASPRTNKWKLRGFVLANGTNPGVNVTLSVFPLLAVGGTSGLLAYTLDVSVPGSSATLTAPSANTAGQATSGDFTAPAPPPRWYVVGVQLNTNQAAGSVIQVGYELLNRQV